MITSYLTRQQQYYCINDELKYHQNIRLSL